MDISQIISTQIIPVLLLPVTGLLALTFYNKSGAMNQRIRFVQKELRDLLIERKASQRHTELSETLTRELKGLHRRSRILYFAVTCCLLAIIFFCLCAVFVALGIFFSGTSEIALVFWFAGPILICLGAGCGVAELILTAKTIHLQTQLIEKWDASGDF